MHFKANRYIQWILVFTFSLFSICKVASAKSLRVAVASNFLETAQKLASEFESTTQHKIQLTSGSSGKFYLQITHGAPFDLFLSADSQKPNELVKNGLASEDSLTTYAMGKLSLWMKYCRREQPLNALLSNEFARIAIANPAVAPYGVASKKLLERHQSNYKEPPHNSLWDQLNDKIVYSENISQVSQLVMIGSIDAAFIATSHKERLYASCSSCVIDFPSEQYPTINYPAIEQQLVLISRSQNKPLAQDFIKFIKSKKGQDLIKNMGYLLPESDKIAPTK